MYEHLYRELTCSHVQICPGLNANEIHIPYDKHHRVSSLVKSHQNKHNSVKYEVIRKCQIALPNVKYKIKQYLRSILDMRLLVGRGKK